MANTSYNVLWPS